MDIVGLHMGHNSTVALLRDGEFVEAISEERFAYEKNIAGFPNLAMDYLLRKYNVDTSGALLALAAESPGALKYKPSRGKNYVNNRWFQLTHEHPWVYEIAKPYINHRHTRSSEDSRNEFEAHLMKLGFKRQNISYVEHHTAHAYTPLAFVKWDESTVLTLDGGGDQLCSTVWENKGAMRRIAQTPVHNSLGVLYSCLTEHLGMRILEHEYKVMGLAAYVRPEYSKGLLEDFRKVIYLNGDGLTFGSKFATSRFAAYLDKHHKGARFDNLACAAQLLTEELMLRWARNCVDATGIPNLAVSGGVFMNVKANMLLANDESFKEAFFTPSAGDESNAIGAAMHAYVNSLGKKPSGAKPMRELYLGIGFTNEQVGEYLKRSGAERRYKVEYIDDIEPEIARLLAKGKIVARFSGRCEFGARALGNRTIMGDPSRMETFYTVNDQIKMRDFWMPFAPSMLDSRADEYIENPLGRKAPYMILAFNSTPEGRKKFIAAMHRGDWTLRPQVVEESWNPGYYRILKEFEGITGIGGCMNTSFNLHGYPIASTPEQAMHVMDNSGLEHLAMENWMVSKR